MNPLAGWTVPREEIKLIGRDLQRPECVLAEPDGTLWSADARGGVMRIGPDGSQSLIAQEVVEHSGDADSVARYVLEGTLPNGLAFDGDGNFVIANFGTDAVERMTRAGESTTLYTQIEGRPIGKANFVLADSRGRIWLTVHTRLDPWTLSVNEKTPDGYIALLEDGEARIVADGFIGTNEIRFDAAEEWLYVVESNARHVSRLRAASDGSLTDREVFGPRDLGGVPDGVAFDEAFSAGTMTPEILGDGRGTLAPMMASVTFGGPDLRTVYLGSLMGQTLPSFRSPVPGLPMAHWHRHA